MAPLLIRHDEGSTRGIGVLAAVVAAAACGRVGYEPMVRIAPDAGATVDARNVSSAEIARDEGAAVGFDAVIDAPGIERPVDLPSESTSLDAPADLVGDLPLDLPVDGPPDGVRDAASACSSWGGWSPPARLATVNSPTDDWKPTMTADGREIYFSSWRGGGVGAPDIWVAVAAGGLTFGAPSLVPGINSAMVEDDPHISADGLELFFSSDRIGNIDLYLATRTDRAAPFSAPRALTELNSPRTDWSPWLSNDGLRLYFTSLRSGAWAVYMGTRTVRGATFGAPAPLRPGLDMGDFLRDMSLSSDELEIFFTSGRAGGVGNLDIWTARRPDMASPFSSPVNVGALNSPNDDGSPFLSRDGTTLLFNYDTRFLGGQNADIWYSQRSCLR